MMRRLLLPLLLCACATVPTPAPEAFIPEARRPEQRALPPSPREEKLPAGVAGEEWVLPAEQGATVPKAGLLASEARVARDILFRTRYDELRKVFDADRMVWKTHRDYYEERLHLAQDEIARLQPTWWDEHKGSLYLVGGVLVGFGLTLGVVEAVYAGR